MSTVHKTALGKYAFMEKIQNVIHHTVLKHHFWLCYNVQDLGNEET